MDFPAIASTHDSSPRSSAISKQEGRLPVDMGRKKDKLKKKIKSLKK
jgi:hypothetical protein